MPRGHPKKAALAVRQAEMKVRLKKIRKDWIAAHSRMAFARTFQPNRYLQLLRLEMDKKEAAIARMHAELGEFQAEYRRYIDARSNAVARINARNPDKYLPMKAWQKRKERIRPLIVPVVAILRFCINRGDFGIETPLERARRLTRERLTGKDSKR